MIKKENSRDAKEAPLPMQELEKPRIHTDAGFRRRIIALAVIMGVLFLIFLIRLAQFQLMGERKDRAQAESGTPSSASQNQDNAPASSLGHLEAKLSNILS